MASLTITLGLTRRICAFLSYNFMLSRRGFVERSSIRALGKGFTKPKTTMPIDSFWLHVSVRSYCTGRWRLLCCYIAGTGGGGEDVGLVLRGFSEIHLDAFMSSE